jgi:hypothetical protein
LKHSDLILAITAFLTTISILIYSAAVGPTIPLEVLVMGFTTLMSNISTIVTRQKTSPKKEKVPK